MLIVGGGEGDDVDDDDENSMRDAFEHFGPCRAISRNGNLPRVFLAPQSARYSY